jgi:hypothetical protein
LHFLFFHQVLKGRHISSAHGESHGRVVCVVEHVERGLSTVVEEPVYSLNLAEPDVITQYQQAKSAQLQRLCLLRLKKSHDNRALIERALISQQKYSATPDGQV